MIITLSEQRNEQLVCEWSGEISDKTAQDFCDVCNSVFIDHFDIDYIRRKYETNIYGKSFIVVIYKDGKPSAAFGAWRNDLEKDRPAFSLVDFATLPTARKNGYALDMLYAIFEAASKAVQNPLIYACTGPMSYPIYKAFGFATKDYYLRFFCGATKDFQDSIPIIDDDYVENFFMRKKDIFVHETRVNTGKTEYFLLRKIKFKRTVPVYVFLGQVNSAFKDKFTRLGRFHFLLYYSMFQRGILRESHSAHVASYELNSTEQSMKVIPPLYKSDTDSLDFNGKNY